MWGLGTEIEGIQGNSKWIGRIEKYVELKIEEKEASPTS
jgi:hypothetical protein